MQRATYSSVSAGAACNIFSLSLLEGFEIGGISSFSFSGAVSGLLSSSLLRGLVNEGAPNE